MDLAQGVNRGVGSERVSSSVFKSSCFSMLPQTEIQLLSRFFCYSKLFCSFGFGLRKALLRDSMKVKVEDAHLPAFRNCIQNEFE